MWWIRIWWHISSSICDYYCKIVFHQSMSFQKRDSSVFCGNYNKPVPIEISNCIQSFESKYNFFLMWTCLS